MESIKNIFRIGKGPSSSHTMGPARAAQTFRKRCPDAAAYRAILYGSLAATGKGHLTDKALKNVLGERLQVVWKPEEELPFHPNGFTFYALDEAKSVISEATFYSTGGGAIREGEKITSGKSIYSLCSLEKIIAHCKKSNLTLNEYVAVVEDNTLCAYLHSAWKAMERSIENGLQKEGLLPGKLKLGRKARQVFLHAGRTAPEFCGQIFISAYALAVSEENASGGVIATAPTCGSSGVLPAVLKYFQTVLSCKQDDILNALATAGLIGALVRQNASISGAEAGCQAEIGTACAMAAASAAQLLGGNLDQIEYAAEMGLEHHLGLTCDPVYGLVQIPCIERNAFAANRALICANYSIATRGEHRIAFDDVVQVMLETGKHMSPFYKETASGGLAKRYQMKHYH
jgi:L-serine dehydratase